MTSSVLEDLCLHINRKITNIKKTLLLRNIGEEPSLKSVLCKITCEVFLVLALLKKMEMEVQQQGKLKNMLKELQKSAEKNQKEAQHLSENIPPYLLNPARMCITTLNVKGEEQTEVVKPKCANKPTKEPRLIKAAPLTAEEFERVPAIARLNVKGEEQTEVVKPKCANKPTKQPRLIKEAPLITAEEFERVPAYMKGRLTHHHVNAVLKDMNKAVMGKYKIVHQPVKSMKAVVRNLYDRFMEEETKDTTGEFFIVEDDIRKFTDLKIDRRFHSIITILRHCRRVREVRGAGLVRYIIC